MSEPKPRLFPELPKELERGIFDYLSLDWWTLRSTILVNKAWSDETTTLLWKCPPKPYHVLASIRESRRQHYADKIRHLNLTLLDEEFEASVLPLQFPNLRTLILNLPGLPRLVPLLQPNLETIQLSPTGWLSENDLELIQIKCPRLRSFTFDGSFQALVSAHVRFLQRCKSLRRIKFSESVTGTTAVGVFEYLATRDIQETKDITEHIRELCLPHDPAFTQARASDPGSISPSWPSPRGGSETFVRFIRPCTNLSVLKLSSSADSLISEEVFEHLVTHWSLRTLELHKYLTLDFVRAALHQTVTTHPFPNVQAIYLRASSAALVPLLSNRSALTSVVLEVDDPSNQACSVVSQLAHLLRLTIRLRSAKAFLVEEFIALSSLRNLVDLRIEELWHTDEYRLSVPWLTNQDFDLWIHSFPHLRVLILEWIGHPLKLTARATAVLAARCPRLTRIGVKWRHDLEIWATQPPIFPMVTWIELGAIKDFEHSNDPSRWMTQAERFVDMLPRFGPNLTSLFIVEGSRSARVMQYQSSVLPSLGAGEVLVTVGKSVEYP